MSRTGCALLWLAACALLQAGSAQNTQYKASLAPLANTTGVALGGSGSAIVELAPSGLNKLTVSVENLGSPVVAWHLHKGLPSDNGPIVLAACGSGIFAQEKVVARSYLEAGKAQDAASALPSSPVPACQQGMRASYDLLPLAQKALDDDLVLSAGQVLQQVSAYPGGWYINVHTVRSEQVAPGKGQIRGQLVRA